MEQICWKGQITTILVIKLHMSRDKEKWHVVWGEEGISLVG